MEQQSKETKKQQKQFALEQKQHRVEWLKDIIKQEKFEFTYIREYDPEFGLNQFGGAVVCWKMPERKNTRMLEVSISWCHDFERFNKVDGRYFAAQNYMIGQKLFFKLPDVDLSISEKLRIIFDNGFQY